MGTTRNQSEALEGGCARDENPKGQDRALCGLGATPASPVAFAGGAFPANDMRPNALETAQQPQPKPCAINKDAKRAGLELSQPVARGCPVPWHRVARGCPVPWHRVARGCPALYRRVVRGYQVTWHRVARGCPARRLGCHGGAGSMRGAWCCARPACVRM